MYHKIPSVKTQLIMVVAEYKLYSCTYQNMYKLKKKLNSGTVKKYKKSVTFCKQIVELFHSYNFNSLPYLKFVFSLQCLRTSNREKQIKACFNHIGTTCIQNF